MKQRSKQMKVLIVGSGGREHAIAWKMAQNKNVEKMYSGWSVMKKIKVK